MRAARFLSTAARISPRPPWTPPHNLKYTLREIDPAIITPSKWSPPMGGYDHLPFRVCVLFSFSLPIEVPTAGKQQLSVAMTNLLVLLLHFIFEQVFRTAKGKQVPVYTDYRNGRTRAMTILRRYRGDVEELAAEMSRVCDGRPVSIRPGRMEVKGNYRGRVAEWLTRLGF